jgi:Laminin G domain
LIEAGTFVGGKTINFGFQYRTTQSDCLLMFAYGGPGSYFLVRLEEAILYWDFSMNGQLNTCMFHDPLLKLCDGQWHNVSLTSQGLQMVITVDGPTNAATSSGDPTARIPGLAVTSYLYVGGIPVSDVSTWQFISNSVLSPAALQNS